MMIYTSCGDKSSSSKGVVLLVSCVSDRKDSWKARGSLTLVFKIAFDTFLIDLIGFHLFKSTVTYILERRFVWKPKESSRVVWITSWLPSRGERWPDQMAVLREYLFLEEEKRREDPGWFRALCSSLYEQFFFFFAFIIVFFLHNCRTLSGNRRGWRAVSNSIWCQSIEKQTVRSFSFGSD